MISWNLAYFSSFKETFRQHFSNKSCPNELKFCEVSWNYYLLVEVWKFQISILKNEKILSLKIYQLSVPCTIDTSMTSLLLHTVAQPTKWRFLPKNLSQLVIFVIELAFTWSWVNKNHQHLIFKNPWLITSW